MRRRIEIVPFDEQWASQFEAEAERIRVVLGSEAVGIYHIGSTAIPGIKAKPTLDFLVEVRSLRRVDELSGRLESLGYQAKGENGITGRRYFQKLDGVNHTHHLHIFETGHPDIERHLNFRDYLRLHPDEALAYSELKERLVEAFREDPDGYTDGKDAFVRDIDQKAKEWKEAGGPAEGSQMTEQTTTDPDELVPPGCGLFVGWALANTVGAALGWALGWRLSFSGPQILSVFMIGATMGAGIGLLQWLVIRGWVKSAVAWLAASTVGWGAGFAVGVAIAQRLSLVEAWFGLVIGAAAGSLFGLFQWIVLRRYVSGAFWWIPVNIFAWTSGMFFYRPGMSAMGAMYGILSGLVTGVALLWLLFRPEPDPEPEAPSQTSL